MLFRTRVYVLLAVREQRDDLLDSDAKWHDTVSYTLGINADNAADAAAVATRAAENAIDRDGRYVGGVVLEVQPKCVGPEEFEGYESYLLQPLDAPGIFYTSGITHTSISLHEANGAAEALANVREWIADNGIPAPSFVHPPLEIDDEPKTVRIVCPVCQHWVEVDSRGLLYSFFDGLEPFSQAYEEGQEAVHIAGPFVRNHFACLKDRDVNALIFLYRGDYRYDLLDDAKRE
jgi:hypothetical protein